VPRAAHTSAFLLLLPVLALVSADGCGPPDTALQGVIDTPGFIERHTPGSGEEQEVPRTPALSALLGDADLNRVTTVRTTWSGPAGADPQVILVLVPGFLGGASTFDPLARDLVEEFRGELEVWAVDRRPNQLEDRLGAEHALTGVDTPACASPPAPDCTIFEGAQFYFPDTDVAPQGDFPGPGDLDIDLDGVLDGQRPLVDRFDVARLPILMAQDDVRFMAYWGLDTYFRDWKRLLEEARARVGPGGRVVLGGHSQGTRWVTTFAAYDFDSHPLERDPGHRLIDGLVLLEGGGTGSPSASAPGLADYEATVAALAQAGGPDVYLEDLVTIPIRTLATVGEVSSIAAFYQPAEPALVQRTPSFVSGVFAFLLSAPATNEAVFGLFLDDDFSVNAAVRASVGFSDDGPNFLLGPPLLPIEAYVAFDGAGLRSWKDFDDPTLPTCPPGVPDASPGCAILDNGPPSDPTDPAASPKTHGMEREVTRLATFSQTQFGKANGFEWYFASGRPNLDFAYGRDSSALVAESLLRDPVDEGPLVVTQNADVDVPVIAIGGSNGLTPEPRSFADYLGSIATPPHLQGVHILEGYAHVDVLTAEQNEAVPLLADFLRQLP
jgi:pimeloyl-ACP methyl ester carboxylesterase